MTLARDVLRGRPRRRDVRAIRHALRARREARRAWQRRVAWRVVCVAVACVLLGLILSAQGCGVTPEFEEAARVEAAAIEQDLENWDELSPLMRRMSHEQCLAFARELLHQLDAEPPVAMTRVEALEALRAYAEARLAAQGAR